MSKQKYTSGEPCDAHIKTTVEYLRKEIRYYGTLTNKQTNLASNIWKTNSGLLPEWMRPLF